MRRDENFCCGSSRRLTAGVCEPCAGQGGAAVLCACAQRLVTRHSRWYMTAMPTRNSSRYTGYSAAEMFFAIRPNTGGIRQVPV